MKIIKASYEIITPISEGGIAELKELERAARICYQSEDAITDDGESAKKIVSRLVSGGHHAMLEFADITVKFICDRGVLAELTRHRIASYAAESTRYCNYSKGKFGGEITVIQPFFFEENYDRYCAWHRACSIAEEQYFSLLADGATPQEARAVLPMSLKTTVMCKASIKEWRHILKLRTAKDAHPQIRELMVPLLAELKSRIPIVFDDIEG